MHPQFVRAILLVIILGVFPHQAKTLPQALKTTPESFIIDDFTSPDKNALGWYHGSSGIGVSFGSTGKRGYLKIYTTDVDAYFGSVFSEGCFDMSAYRNSYLHIEFSGSDRFSVTLQQQNQACDERKIPTPQTWDSVEAARYSNHKTDINIPLSHFDVDLTHVKGITLDGFYTSEPTYILTIEVKPLAPATITIPPKLDSGRIRSTCTRPGLIAFGIDDGVPELAQQTMQIIKDEGIPVTFFTVSEGLLDQEANFTEVYKEMLRLGHQVGLHSYNHPRMEGLQTDAEIDLQMSQSIYVLSKKLGINSTYFRPPFGTVGARTRQGVGRYIRDANIVLWRIDVEDWKWGDSDTPQRQFEAFRTRLDAGGDIVVMHYLYPSTVYLFRQMIRYAKEKGRKFVRMDQCFGDPHAPKSWGWSG